MKKTINKSILKSGYYYEYEPLYDALPDKLPAAECRTVILERDMKYADILNEFNVTPYKSFAEAASVAAGAIDSIRNGEYRVIFFMNGTVPCRLYVWRYDDGYLSLHVSLVHLVLEWNAGYGVIASNEAGNPGALDALAPGNFNPSALTDDQAIEYLKSKGYRITKMIEKEF